MSAPAKLKYILSGPHRKQLLITDLIVMVELFSGLKVGM